MKKRKKHSPLSLIFRPIFPFSASYQDETGYETDWALECCAVSDLIRVHGNTNLSLSAMMDLIWTKVQRLRSRSSKKANHSPWLLRCLSRPLQYGGMMRKISVCNCLRLNLMYNFGFVHSWWMLCFDFFFKLIRAYPIDWQEISRPKTSNRRKCLRSSWERLSRGNASIY